MVYFTDAAAYMEQSILLLQARPTTTRISTRYTLSPPQKPRSKKSKADGTSGAGVGAASESDAATSAPRARGMLVLKTYDPVSGACLQYRTAKQAEISRLVGGMGRCARVMANVPLQSAAEEAEEEMKAAAPAEEGSKVVAGGQEQVQSQSQSQSQSQGGGGGGGGKKKKKGKK